MDSSKMRWNIILVTALVSFILFFEIKTKRERNVFFRSGLSNPIVSIKFNWTGGRSYDYIIDNGVVLTLLNSDSLSVGDSIVKKTNTNKFDVYRERNGEYEFYKSYDIGK